MPEYLKEIPEAIIPFVTISTLTLSAFGFFMSSLRRFLQHRKFGISFSFTLSPIHDFADIFVVLFLMLGFGLILPIFIKSYFDNIVLNISAVFLLALIGYCAIFMQTIAKFRLKKVKLIILFLSLYAILYAAFLLAPVSLNESSSWTWLSFLAVLTLLMYFAWICTFIIRSIVHKVLGKPTHYPIVKINGVHYWIILRHSRQEWICTDYYESDNSAIQPVKWRYLIKNLEGMEFEVLKKDEAIKRKKSEIKTNLQIIFKE